MASSKAGDESPRLYKFNGILMYVHTWEGLLRQEGVMWRVGEKMKAEST